MPPVARCPRCDAELLAPGPWSSDWRCPGHGVVLPFTRYARIGPPTLEHVRTRCAVPLWAPSPMPAGWVLTGLGHAGEEREGARASVLVCSGPGPLEGSAELALVAEDPGIGLGARLAGLDTADPGRGFDSRPAEARVEAAGHPTALWSLTAAPGRASFVGEAKGLWLWAVVAPASAGVLLYENLVLRDLREECADGAFEFGPPSPLLESPGG
jgi:hypothetical protein